MTLERERGGAAPALHYCAQGDKCHLLEVASKHDREQAHTHDVLH